MAKKDASNSINKTKTTKRRSRKIAEEEEEAPTEGLLDDSTVPLERTKRKTSVEIGTAFELRALKLLRENFSMALERVAGPGDGGVDLVGWWWLPHLPGLPLVTDSTGQHSDPAIHPMDRSRIRVWAQCKAERTKMGPNYVREMEGVLYRLQEMVSEPWAGGPSPTKPHTTPSLAMLISLSPFTKGAVMRAMSSPMPFILLHLPPESNSGGDDDGLKQHRPSLQWNAALGSEKGILGGNFEVRWERGPDYERPRLWWKNQPLPDCVPS
ncbi:hypothetical protein CPB86DRAFT_749303 [Serendipita vermifera]|nr:hypothetical protein CPB86DRAFT_749303 [Serendipita vermifera]